MQAEAFIGFYLYSLAVGITAAALVVTGYNLVTNERASFQNRAQGLVNSLGQLLVVVIGGPFIILRNLIRARRVEQRPFGFLIAGSALAAVWCFCSGIMFLAIAGKFV